MGKLKQSYNLHIVVGLSIKHSTKIVKVHSLPVHIKGLNVLNIAVPLTLCVLRHVCKCLIVSRKVRCCLLSVVWKKENC